MPLQIPIALIEFILLGPQDDRRQLQDTPILGDVWVEYGKEPNGRVDLLIAPFRGQHAGDVAVKIDEELRHSQLNNEDIAEIAYLQGLIVANLTFEELMRVVATKTNWWISKKTGDGAVRDMIENGDARSVLKKILDSAVAWHSKTGKWHFQEMPAFNRFLALTALILWAGSCSPTEVRTNSDDTDYILEQAKANLEQMSNRVGELLRHMLNDSTEKALVWQVSLNRTAMPAISKSIPAVKADAATTLFKVNCGEICWAVIDSGIDGNHPAFFDKEGISRVKRSFDFQNFRKIMSLGNLRDTIRQRNLADLLEEKDNLKHPLQVDEADEALKRLAEDARKRGPVQWELVQKFVEIKPTTPTHTNHGTHVAGIIGASKIAAQIALSKAEALKSERKGVEVDDRKHVGEIVERAVESALEKVAGKDNPTFADGMCPDISLYDFRVLGPRIEDAEFAIIAALQFIRYLNSQDNFLVIHGANLSLSLPHDVRNFACGRTPICNECEQLVSSGVVVVSAAGNHGYKSFETKDGSYDSYAAFSITDPGNADSVLTVGATHRFWPHTYGISFFSSRGPTGDGRMKPDLVAPGERIRAPVPGNNELGGEWGEMDGTSMAAPHVSGAAAMLMARYSELVGQPLRIKRILCESATDLGRERSFQGNGMLDVLRAFQSI